MRNNRGCIDFIDTNSAVVRVCQEENYCHNNPCISFCDDYELFNNKIKWSPERVFKQVTEFQKRFDVILNNRNLTASDFNKRSE